MSSNILNKKDLQKFLDAPLKYDESGTNTSITVILKELAAQDEEFPEVLINENVIFDVLEVIKVISVIRLNYVVWRCDWKTPALAVKFIEDTADLPGMYASDFGSDSIIHQKIITSVLGITDLQCKLAALETILLKSKEANIVLDGTSLNTINQLIIKNRANVPESFFISVGEYIYNSIIDRGLYISELWMYIKHKPDSYKMCVDMYSNKKIDKDQLIDIIYNMDSIEDAFNTMDLFEGKVRNNMRKQVILPRGIITREEYKKYKTFLDPYYIAENLDKEDIIEYSDDLSTRSILLTGRVSLEELRELKPVSEIKTWVKDLLYYNIVEQEEILNNKDIISVEDCMKTSTILTHDTLQELNEDAFIAPFGFPSSDKWEIYYTKNLTKKGFSVDTLSLCLDLYPTPIPSVMGYIKNKFNKIKDDELKAKLEVILKLYK